LRGHHDTAETLADAGFVVAAINHPGDNAFDASRTDDLSVLIERPSDIKRLIDFMLGAWPETTKIDRERIGVFGSSAVIPTSVPASLTFARRTSRAESASKSERTRSRSNPLPMTRASRPQ
jgi:hypothetical protein